MPNFANVCFFINDLQNAAELSKICANSADCVLAPILEVDVSGECWELGFTGGKREGHKRPSSKSDVYF